MGSSTIKRNAITLTLLATINYDAMGTAATLNYPVTDFDLIMIETTTGAISYGYQIFQSSRYPNTFKLSFANSNQITFSFPSASKLNVSSGLSSSGIQTLRAFGLKIGQ